MLEIKTRFCSKSELNVHLQLENGTNVIVDFKGRDVLKKEFFVDVKDPLIKKALESNKFFGVYFEKSNEYDWMEVAQVEEPVEETTETTETVVEETTETVETPVEEVPATETEQDIVTKEFPSGQAAKEWLNKTFNTPFSKMRTNESTEKEFSALGLKLVITPKN